MYRDSLTGPIGHGLNAALFSLSLHRVILGITTGLCTLDRPKIKQSEEATFRRYCNSI